jgi:hypothetical protein
MTSDPPQAEAITALLERAAEPDVARASATPSQWKNTIPSRQLRITWAGAAWSRVAIHFVFLATVLTWLIAIAIWLSVLADPKRNPLAFDSRPTLREATRQWVAQELKPDYDQLALYLRSTLSILHDFTAEGAPYRPLLKGMVAPKILAEADAGFNRDLTLIKKQGIRQTFRLSRIDDSDIVVDKDTNRVAVTVRGTFELNLDAEPRSRPVKIPYAARVVLSPNTPSQVNPYLFYVEAIERLTETSKK